jgi:hypothetical protein
VAIEALDVGNVNATEHELSPWHQRMNVIADSNMNHDEM